MIGEIRDGFDELKRKRVSYKRLKAKFAMTKYMKSGVGGET